MPDRPPSDLSDHAEDFARRYAEDLDVVVGQVMIDLGLASDRMGARDPDRNCEHHCFFPSERTGGGVGPSGQVTLDSGLMNPQLLSPNYDEATQRLWMCTRIQSRTEAIITHELAEYECGGDHELALIAGAETKRPISQAARELLRAMQKGWRGR